MISQTHLNLLRASLQRMADLAAQPLSEDMLREIIERIPECAELAQTVLDVHFSTVPEFEPPGPGIQEGRALDWMAENLGQPVEFVYEGNKLSPCSANGRSRRNRFARKMCRDAVDRINAGAHSTTRIPTTTADKARRACDRIRRQLIRQGIEREEAARLANEYREVHSIVSA